MKIGMILPLAQDEHGHAPTWQDLQKAALLSEARGFESIWVYDHLFHRFDGHPTVGFWECWTMLTALAAVTHRVELGTTVLCAGFRNPALLAKMADTLDEVSGGRLILGLGAGWHEPEFDAFDIPFDHRVSRFEEALQIIKPLLRQREVTFVGDYHAARECVVIPAGPRPEGVPLLVAAFGPRMLRLTARYADQWTTDWLGPVDKVRGHIADLREACEAEGRDLASLVITGGVTVACPELGELPSWMSAPDAYIPCDPASIAARFAEYEAEGVDHILTNLYPFTPEAIDRYADAVDAWRGTAR